VYDLHNNDNNNLPSICMQIIYTESKEHPRSIFVITLANMYRS